jgi:lipopolysaccharide transport system ATP-binding protein
MTKAQIDHKFDDIVAFAEVEKFIDTPVKFFSSGMSVRLAFAVAAHLEPEIMLVDEVLAVGDAAFQKKCLNKMESVGQEGRTILFVSHHMPSITRLCERTILVDDGQVVMDGPTQQVVAEYLSAGLGLTAIRRWEDLSGAPGNEIVRLRAVRVKTEDGRIADVVDIRMPIGIEMEYEVFEPGHVLYPHFTLHNEEGVWVFASMDTDLDWRGRPRPAGRYVSTGWIPGNFLAEGMMIIGPAMKTEYPHKLHFHTRDAVAFQVVESSKGDTARVDSVGHFPGVVRPFLKWTTQQDGSTP